MQADVYIQAAGTIILTPSQSCPASSLQGTSSKQADVSAYMTGVVEVQLPMDYKIKNIEDTEAAKKGMLGASRHAAYR